MNFSTTSSTQIIINLGGSSPTGVGLVSSGCRTGAASEVSISKGICDMDMSQSECVHVGWFALMVDLPLLWRLSMPPAGASFFLAG